jgi:hypothetical protein
MPRPRTTKGLAKRIELTYYKELSPFRRWWRILSIAVPAAGALWLVVTAVLGDERIYTSGPVVTAHRMFEAECTRCHAEVARPIATVAATTDTAPAGAAPKPSPPARTKRWFFARVSDGACLSCHDGAVHHDTQLFEPTCATCHTEHEGKTTLARIRDRHCTQCHADLKAKGAPPKFEPRVVSFANHPEFAILRKNLKDEAQIKLSHATHLKEGLPAGGGKRVTLGCVSCHLEDAAGQYILPIKYETHCKGCHPLEVGADLVAPHQRPEIVRGFLLASLGRRGGGAPAQPAKPAEEEKKEEAPTGRRRGGAASAPIDDVGLRLVQFHELPAQVQLAQRRRGGEPEPPAPPPAQEEGAGQPTGRRRGGEAAPEKAPAATPTGAPPAAVAQAEKELFTGRQGCPYCHTVERTEDLPKIAPPKIPDRWLSHSAFGHRAHRPLACVACHAAAPKSVETSDVLMPKIQVCQECHREGGGAQAGCVECHLYHDRAKERVPDGPLTIPQFSGRGPTGAVPAPKTQ